MSSNASSSGIESDDTDSSPNLPEEKDPRSISDINNCNDESINTLINDNEDEGFLETKESDLMLDKNNLLPHQSITSKLNPMKPSHYPNAIRNPYDDDTNSSSVVEDWDEECKGTEPYHYPSYIRRAQWPNHWRWTPPLGIRRTCTQQLHRNLGFEPPGLFDDSDCFSSNINFRHFRFDF